MTTAVANPSIPLEPPREWFTPPETMPKDAGCIVEPNGRIYGYLCHWNTILFDGTNDRWTPPRSRHGYAYAHTGDTICADGSVVKTANLGGDAGHAKADPYDVDRLSNLQDFYENTSTQLARVVYGEDDNGVWFAGACWPTVTDLEMAKLRASARSGHWAAIGDWRDINSGRAGYELVGACLVNVPGLKYARADRAASGVLTLNPLHLNSNGADHAGAMVAIFLDDPTAKALAVEGGEPPEQLHITLAYFNDAGADRQDWDAIHTLVGKIRKKHMPLYGKIGGQGVFRTPDGDVHWASPDVPGLAELRTELVAALDLAGFEVRADHGFTPHITLAYTDSGAEAPLVGEHEVSFDELTLAVGGEMTKLSSRPTTPTMERIASSGTSIHLAGDEVARPDGVAVSGILVVEGSPTEDGRFIDEGAISWRDLPLPLYAKLENTEGHSDAQLIGRIDTIERSEADPKVIGYTGTILPDAGDGYGQRVLEAIGDQTLKGVSIDGIGGPDDSWIDQDEVWHMSKLVIAGATLTPMPAISEASVTIGLTCGGDTMADDELLDDGSDEAAVEVPEDTSADDQWAAVNDKLDALLASNEQIIGLLESAQLSARLNAIKQRELEAAKV